MAAAQVPPGSPLSLAVRALATPGRDPDGPGEDFEVSVPATPGPSQPTEGTATPSSGRRSKKRKRGTVSEEELSSRLEEFQGRMLQQMAQLLRTSLPPPPPASPAGEAAGAPGSPDRVPSPAPSHIDYGGELAPEARGDLSNPPGLAPDAREDPSQAGQPSPPPPVADPETAQPPARARPLSPSPPPGGQDPDQEQPLVGPMPLLPPAWPNEGWQQEDQLEAEEEGFLQERLARIEGLQDFALPGMAPAFSAPRQQVLGPTPLQARLWIAARGGQAVQHVAFDKAEAAYKTGAGVFQPAPLPKALSFEPAFLEGDSDLRDVQAQWGVIGFAIAKATTKIEEVVRSIQERTNRGEAIPAEDASRLSRDLALHASRPLAHAFRISAARANMAHKRRRDRLVRVVDAKDRVLARALKEAPLGTEAFFAPDPSQELARAIERADRRKSERDSSLDLVRHMWQGRPHAHNRRPDPPRHRPAAALGAPPRQGRGTGQGAPPSRGQQNSRQPFRAGRPGRQGRGRRQSSNFSRQPGSAPPTRD